MVSLAWTEGFYVKPRIDQALLREHSKGLIALSACLAGEIPRRLRNGEYDNAKAYALEMAELFGPDRFYLELQDHGIRDQKIVNQSILKIHQETGIPMVCTNDAHYLRKEDAEAHDILLCIQTGKTVDDENRMRYEPQNFYLRSEEEMAALFAGVMLAVAGCIIQRLTGNPMASPEVLGISSGAAFGVVLMLFLVPGNAFGWLLPAGSLGAAVTLLIIMIAAGRGGFSPHRMLLAGMALSTAFTMLLMMLQASGDPRMAQVLTWISGSTYNATDAQVWRTGIVMVILLAITPLCRRWLTILPLGGDTARAVGMALTPTRIALLLLAACLTATATMTIGPLSFVGLMAPHIARMMGFRRTMPHIVISALVGGLLLVFADWCGRMVLFPFQIPAGLLSTFIGAPYFIYLLRKQSR